MSHSVTIRTTTTTTSGSSIILNTGYLRTLPGFLKLLEVALGIVCVGIMGHVTNQANYNNQSTHKLFFLLMTTTFLIASFILLVSCLASLSTGSIISKTIYEVIYHLIGFILLLAASVTLLVEVNRNTRHYYYETLLAAAIIGLVNSALFLLSTLIALKSYRGI